MGETANERFERFAELFQRESGYMPPGKSVPPEMGYTEEQEVERLRLWSAFSVRMMRGLYNKFRVARTDGTDAPGGKHEGCRYFVLDLTHDPYAMPAIRAYARAAAKYYPALAADLRRVADGEVTP